MKLVLYVSNKYQPMDDPVNEGFKREEILRLLEALEAQGHITCEVVDTDTLPNRVLHEIYTKATIPAVQKGRLGYSIRQVFGSRRKSGTFFGKQVPALLVYEAGEQYPTDVYPHQLGPVTITIREFLESLG